MASIRFASRSLRTASSSSTRTRILTSLPIRDSRARATPSFVYRLQSTSALAAPISSNTSLPSTPYTIDGKEYPLDRWSNTPSSILSKVNRNLHLEPSHPISIIRQIIESHFSQHTPLSPSTPIVSIHQNFDELGFPPDHPGRSLTDSYYLNSEYMLRTHTSAHEVETYKKGLDKWLLTADVYRRDEIDSSHYPVFHQMEGTHIWPTSDLHLLKSLNKELVDQLANCHLIIEDQTTISSANPYQECHDPKYAEEITKHLKHSLNSLIFRLFGGQARSTKDGEPLRIRWIEAYFPFTTPSYEVEIWWGGEWLEVLGCGVVMQKTLDQAGMSHKAGWAFGLGLERLSMVLFSIPDIRLFWTTDDRFHSQFSSGQITTFKEYSRYPPCYKDMSFWLPPSSSSSPSPEPQVAEAVAGEVEAGVSPAGGMLSKGHGQEAIGVAGAAGGGIKEFHENDYCEIVRDVAGDLVETVTLIDEFTHPKTNRKSKCYRLNYRHMDRSLSNEEVNALQDKVQKRVVQEMGIEMR